MEDFHRKRFLEGGITQSQLIFLFESADKERYADFKVYAGLHGIDLDSEDLEGNKGSAAKKRTAYAFGDPAEYENMTDAERETETQHMMSHWKGFKFGKN